MLSIPVFIGAAAAEIAGCFAFWAWLRLDKPAWWIAPGIASLLLFAYLLTLAESPFAGRAYAAYGGVYIAASLLVAFALILSAVGIRGHETFPPSEAAGRGLSLLAVLLVAAAMFTAVITG